MPLNSNARRARTRAPATGLAVLATGLACGAALATEGGGTSKALGVDTVMAGVMPPPGLRLTVFVASYEAGKTLDRTGQPRPGLSNFDLSVQAVTPRFQYVWPGVELWGANLETRAGITVHGRARVQFDVNTPGGPLRRYGKDSGGGDALVAPVLLGWHSQTLHQTAGLQWFIATGAFNPSQLSNLGRGNDATGLLYALTWYPTAAVELSVSSNYLVNRRNPDTNYRGGRELSIDYGLGYALAPEWQAGVSGYVYRQTSDDRQNGQVVAGGNRGQALAAGPFVRYSAGGGWGITLKHQAETRVENRTSGQRLFLQIAMALR